ncbi:MULTISPECIES: SDR family NAD(P)-dependent oxidoreductase [Kitasatospora]|uniref:SDR family oxidoreductase n=1 Tax=Kitasatospora cystarginea TaxID=58350 RepID=A0ABN3F086_9ACTN
MNAQDAFAGRTALVTGSSRGLGLLIAGELADRGCRVMLCARDTEALAAAERSLRGRPGEVASTAVDLLDPDTPRRLVEETRRRLGSEPDVLVNNAGIIQVGPLAALQEQDFQRAVETMLAAPLRLVLAVLPGMRARRCGNIVNITSIGGRVPVPHLLPYVVAKFAATGLSEGLHTELAADGIRVTTVLPGLMRTGSHNAAEFAGQVGREYAWFATSASLPLLSVDARRAARAIVRAAGRGRAELVLTPAAKAAILAHGLAPGVFVRTLGAVARLLPAPGGSPRHAVPGARAACHHPADGVVARLTVLGEQAGRRYNEPPAQWR